MSDDNKFIVITLINSEKDNLKYTEYCKLLREKDELINAISSTDDDDLKEMLKLRLMNDVETKLGNTKVSNYYYGSAQAFQANGQTKRYRNENGFIKIETSKWKDDKIKQTVETRKNPDNWDSSVKEFVDPIIMFNKVKCMEEEDINNYDFKNHTILIKWNRHNEKKALLPGQTLEFTEEGMRIY